MTVLCRVHDLGNLQAECHCSDKGDKRAPTVHIFTCDSGRAYDITQTTEGIKDGDVLIVPSEEIVGIMVKAWPTAITTTNGHFHTTTDRTDILDLEYRESVNLANEYIDREWVGKYLVVNTDILRERHNVHM